MARTRYPSPESTCEQDLCNARSIIGSPKELIILVLDVLRGWLESYDTYQGLFLSADFEVEVFLDNIIGVLADGSGLRA